MLARLTLAIVLVLAVAPGALASHSFPADVPDSHPFHTEIGIFKDTNITVGCSATAFCPSDFVRRQAMAAFVDRALGLLVRPGESTQSGVAGSRVEMLDDDLSFVGTEGNALRFRGPSYNVAGGWPSNAITPGVIRATIAGGGAGATANQVTDDYGTVGGGDANRAGNSSGATDDARFATVAGGFNNRAMLAYSAVAGGSGNTASYFSSVGGGEGNNADSQHATVPGGLSNTASGARSFAAGTNAKATDKGSFVWADSYFGLDIGSNGADTFTARATGGVRFISAIDAQTGAPTAGVSLSSGGGSWSSLSDRNAKHRFRAVDKRALLRRLARIPIRTWSYRTQGEEIRHIGPTAQDFARAFRVGEDARHITTVDADGVALAAIQALHREALARAADVRRLKRQNHGQRARLADQGARIATLEQIVARLSRRDAVRG